MVTSQCCCAHRVCYRHNRQAEITCYGRRWPSSSSPRFGKVTRRCCNTVHCPHTRWEPYKRQGQDVDEASGSRVDHRDTLRHPPRLRDRRGQGGRRAWVPAEIPPVPLRAPVAVHGSPSHEHRYAELQDILLMSVLGRLCSEMRFLGCYRDNGSAVRCWGRGVLDRLPVDAPGCRHGAHALVHCVHVTRVMSPYIHPAESTRQLLSCDSI